MKLSPTYYLDNFEEILSTVERRYGDLLSTAESAFLVDYRALDRGASGPPRTSGDGWDLGGLSY